MAESFQVRTIRDAGVSDFAQIVPYNGDAAVIIGRDFRCKKGSDCRKFIWIRGVPFKICHQREMFLRKGIGPYRCSLCGVPLERSGDDYHVHPQAGVIPCAPNGNQLKFVSVEDGNKLFFAGEATSDESVVVVFETIPSWPQSSHGGDVMGWECQHCGDSSQSGVAPEDCPKCGKNARQSGPLQKFGEFPGTIISSVRVEEEYNGRIHEGEQLVAVIPKGVVFSVTFSILGDVEYVRHKWVGDQLIRDHWRLGRSPHMEF